MLTQEQIDQFKRDGYVMVPGLYTPEEIRQITAWTEEVTSWPEIPGKYMMYFETNRNNPDERILCRMEDIEPFHEGFSKLFTGEKMQGAVSDLFGDAGEAVQYTK